MSLENRLEKRVRDWERLAKAFRLAKEEREPSQEEWRLNATSEEAYERCASEIREDLAAARTIRRSPYAPFSTR